MPKGKKVKRNSQGKEGEATKGNLLGKREPKVKEELYEKFAGKRGVKEECDEDASTGRPNARKPKVKEKVQEVQKKLAGKRKVKEEVDKADEEGNLTKKRKRASEKGTSEKETTQFAAPHVPIKNFACDDLPAPFLVQGRRVTLMFRIADFRLFERILDVVNHLSQRFTFHYSTVGMMIQTLDTTQIALVDLSLERTLLLDYHCDAPQRLGIHLPDLLLSLQVVETEDTEVYVRKLDGDLHLQVRYVRRDKEKVQSGGWVNIPLLADIPPIVTIPEASSYAAKVKREKSPTKKFPFFLLELGWNEHADTLFRNIGRGDGSCYGDRDGGGGDGGNGGGLQSFTWSEKSGSFCRLSREGRVV